MEIKNKADANKVISEKLKQIEDLFKECEKIADEHQCHFQFSLTYGAGASYTPKPKEEEIDPEWDESTGIDDEYGWQASSQSC